jgi:hypothetical protein
MELRSLQITLYIGALTLVACGSSNTNSSPFENATTSPNVKGQDASTGNTSSGGGSNGSSSGGGSANSSSGGGTDNTMGSASTCKVDSDCTGACNGAGVCCCDPNALTCFTPEGGSCGTSGDDGGGSGDDDSGTPPI